MRSHSVSHSVFFFITMRLKKKKRRKRVSEWVSVLSCALTRSPAYSLIPHNMYVNASKYKMSCVQPIKYTLTHTERERPVKRSIRWFIQLSVFFIFYSSSYLLNIVVAAASVFSSLRMHSLSSASLICCFIPCRGPILSLLFSFFFFLKLH